MSMKDALRPMRAHVLRSLLIEYAGKYPNKVTTYGDWMGFFGDGDEPLDRFELNRILGKVVEIDRKMGTPPVACLVTRKKTNGKPGTGFVEKLDIEGLNPDALPENDAVQKAQMEVWSYYFL